MIKIDLNKVCCFSLLFANLYSPSGLLCYFLVASPIERRSRLAIENIEKAIYEVIVPLPLPLLLRPHFIQIGPTFLCPRFLYTSMLWILIHPDILYTTHQLLCANFSASAVLWLEEYINYITPLRTANY